MNGETMLRVANVGNEAAMESVRDALDRLGIAYEHVRSEPDDDRFPQTAYFYVPEDSADWGSGRSRASRNNTASMPRCFRARRLRRLASVSAGQHFSTSAGSDDS